MLSTSRCTLNGFQKSRQDVRSTNRGEVFQRRVRLTVRPLLASADNTVERTSVLNIVKLIKGASL